MTTLRHKKIAKKKKEILKSALSIISKKGYHATTMEDIAANLLVTKGSVYYYFKDKQDLIFQSYLMLLDIGTADFERIKQEEISPVVKLRKTMQSHMALILNERTGFEIGFKPEQFFNEEQLEKVIQNREEYANFFEDIIKEGIDAGVFRDVNVKVTRNILLGAMNWLLQWYSPKGKLNPEEMGEMMSDYLLNMLLKEQELIK